MKRTVNNSLIQYAGKSTVRWSGPMFCSNCGTEVQEDAVYCHRCGTLLARGPMKQLAPSFTDQGSQSSPSVSPIIPSYGGPPPNCEPCSPLLRKHRASGAAALATTLALTALLLIVAVSQGWVNPSVTNTNSGGQKVTDMVGNYSASYSWVYPYNSGKVWTISVTIPKTTFADYKNQDRTTNYASYVTKDDVIINRVAWELKNDSEEGGYDTAQFVLSFVQNIPYGTDINTTGYTDYPRYPVETLVDDVGDCKDHSTLYASLLDAPAINDGVVLFELWPQQGSVGHMAVGLWGSGYTGTYVSYEGRDYYYCETTAPGWHIGDMPSDLTNYSIQVVGT